MDDHRVNDVNEAETALGDRPVGFSGQPLKRHRVSVAVNNFDTDSWQGPRAAPRSARVHRPARRPGHILKQGCVRLEEPIDHRGDDNGRTARYQERPHHHADIGGIGSERTGAQPVGLVALRAPSPELPTTMQRIDQHLISPVGGMAWELAVRPLHHSPLTSAAVGSKERPVNRLAVGRRILVVANDFSGCASGAPRTPVTRSAQRSDGGDVDNGGLRKGNRV